MKKVVQLALLMTCISTATTHCWEWSDVVPTRLSNWYQDWQIRKQELQEFKQLNRPYPTGYILEGRTFRPQTRIEWWEKEKSMNEQRASSTAGVYSRIAQKKWEREWDAKWDKERQREIRAAQITARNMFILKKYEDLPQVKLHNKYFYSDYF